MTAPSEQAQRETVTEKAVQVKTQTEQVPSSQTQHKPAPNRPHLFKGRLRSPPATSPFRKAHAVAPVPRDEVTITKAGPGPSRKSVSRFAA